MNLTNLKGGTGTIVKHSNKQLFEFYLRDIAKHKPLSREEEIEAFKIIKETKDPQAIEKVWKHNLLFVVSVARKYAASINSSVITMEDLVTEGNIGLYNAIEKFDYTKGYKFISYAVWHIRQCILDSINKDIISIKLPSNIKGDIKKIKKIRQALEQEHGRLVNTLEVFESTLEKGGLKNFNNLSKMEEMLKLNQFEQSLNTKIGEEEQIEIGDLIEDGNPSPEDIMIKDEREKLAHIFLNDIPSEVSNYIRDYFGIGTNDSLNYTEIANKYGKKQYYIRNIVEKHLLWLRIKNKNSKEFFFPVTNKENKIKNNLDNFIFNENVKTTCKKSSKENTNNIII
jgi:RNA polymerase primary sigma factor